MKKRYLAAAAVALVAALYASPYVSLHNMRQAAESGDAVALRDHVDFPAVRESLKGTLVAAVTKDAATQDNPFAALGAMLAAKVVDVYVDQLVTPEGMASMLVQGKAKAAGEDAKAAEVDATQPVTDTAYRGWDRFEVKVSRTEDASSITGTLRRENLFFWKLTHIDFQMPK